MQEDQQLIESLQRIADHRIATDRQASSQKKDFKDLKPDRSQGRRPHGPLQANRQPCPHQQFSDKGAIPPCWVRINADFFCSENR
jgi:hypothetical protein